MPAKGERIATMEEGDDDKEEEKGGRLEDGGCAVMVVVVVVDCSLSCAQGKGCGCPWPGGSN